MGHVNLASQLVLLPLELNNLPHLASEALARIQALGLAARLDDFPGHLSGGERQRVAVCRALIHQPSLLLADEPTGNLDPTTAQTIGELLLKMAAEHDAALLCVTHSDSLAAQFPHVMKMENRTVEFVGSEDSAAPTKVGP